MRSAKVLALLISIISFQPLQATYPTIQESSSSSSKESVNFFGRAKQLLSSWLPSFNAAPSPEITQTWETEWDQLVDHVAQENAKQIKSLFSAMVERKVEYLAALDQGVEAYYKKLRREKSLPETTQFIRKQDKKLSENLDKGLLFLLQELAQETDSYLEANDIKALSNRDYRERLGQMYTMARSTTLDQDFYDKSLFDHGHDVLNKLNSIMRFEKTSENLPRLKKEIKGFYIEQDGGKLSESSLEILNSLGMHFRKPQAKLSWLTSERIGTGLTLLLVSSSALATVSMISRVPMASAKSTNQLVARPNILASVCGDFTSITECFSSFSLRDPTDSDVTLLLSNSYFQDVVTNTLIESRSDLAIGDTRGGGMAALQPTYSDITYFTTQNISSATQGDPVNQVAYTIQLPYNGVRYTPVDNTYYNVTTYTLTGINGTPQNETTYTLGNAYMADYYMGLPSYSNSRFFVVSLNDTKFVGANIIQVNGSTPVLDSIRVMTSATRDNRVIPYALVTTGVDTTNPNPAYVRQSLDSLLATLHSGNVAPGPCSTATTGTSILNYLSDQGITAYFQSLATAMGKPGIHPLVLSSSMQRSGLVSSYYFFKEQNPYTSAQTLTIRRVEGPQYTDCSYQSSSGTVQEKCSTVTWYPDLQTATYTNGTVSGTTLSSLTGSILNYGTVQKLARINLASNSTSAIWMLIAQSANGTVSSPQYYASAGPELCLINPQPTTPTGPTPTDPTSPTTPGTSPKSSGLSDGAKIGIGVGVGGAALLTAIGVGVGCGLKKNKDKKNNGAAYVRPTTSSTPLMPVTVKREGFNASAKGIFSGISVTGKLFDNLYSLLFKVTEEKFKEIVTETGLKLEFKPDEDSEMDLILGGGNFGQVRLAQDQRTGEYVAVKIISGNEKVKNSLREGDMQNRLANHPHVLPLLDRLHYKPATDKAASTELLKKAFGNTNGKNEDLLLQFTPLASFGDGEALSYRLSLLQDADLKEKIVTSVAYCFVTGLMNMHNNGVSHLDFKLSNLLLSWKGDVWVSDMGCAVQKKLLSGGLGDFRYFSPERLMHLRYLSEKQKNPGASKKGDLQATFSGHAADSFAVGVAIYELIFNQHPFQEVFDQREKGVSIPHLMIKEWTTVDYREGLVKAFSDQKGRIFDVIRQLITIKPEERWTMIQAHKALKKLLPKESPEELFSRFEQTLLNRFRQDHPEKTEDVHAYYQYVSPGAKKPEEMREKAYLYYQDTSTEETSSQVYGSNLPIYQDMQEVYQQPSTEDEPHYTAFPDEEEPTYTVFPDASQSSPPPPRKGREPSEDQPYYQQ